MAGEGRVARSAENAETRKSKDSPSLYAVGDRIRYVNYDDNELGGTVIAVTSIGYRIKWDDGYKDESGPTGYYGNQELVAE